MAPFETVCYNWIDGVEELEEYQPGGYHPIIIGDLLHDRYQIVSKLGYGGYSTIWLAHDQSKNRFVAVKVGVSGSDRLGRESRILQELSSLLSRQHESQSLTITANESDVIPKVQDEFEIKGPNGIHPCFTMEPTQRSLRLAAFSRLFRIQVARALCAKLALAVSSVHSRGYVHGGNVLIRLPFKLDHLSVDQFKEEYSEPNTEPITRQDGKPLTPHVPSKAVYCRSLDRGKKAQDFEVSDAQRLLLSDFGEAYAPAKETRLGKDCRILLEMRAPESLFEPNIPLSYPSDIWTLALTIWKMLSRRFLFYQGSSEHKLIEQHLDLLGSNHFPSTWRELRERPHIDEDKDCDTNEIQIPRRPTRLDEDVLPPLEEAFEQFIQKTRRKQEEKCGEWKQKCGVFDEDEKRAILDLIRGMMRFRPEERLTINEVLQSEWMQKWALPALEE
ncbi:hypothetical protein E4U43_000115 [Claviceps pusilla]|uniref:non-specific serine/threonine protein kinase n=1 Tax=Claviceps pusilla TaxID=123648 RepID=A0A9P7NA67_9HYPO|nr:hypothetical protein E4U43_000115 [Claviceps pusilla]